MANSIISQDELISILQPLAAKVADDFEMQSFNVISAFYGDYEPIMYERAFGMYGMWKTEINPIEDGLSVVITYSSALIGGQNSQHKFAGPFMQGYHGGPLAWGHPRKVPKMSPSPYELIMEFFNSYEL